MLHLKDVMLDHLGKTAAQCAVVSQMLPVIILLESVQMAVVHQDGQGLIVIQVWNIARCCYMTALIPCEKGPNK